MHECYAPMLKQTWGETWKTQTNSKLHMRWRGPLMTILHEISSGWPSWMQLLPEITKMAIITCGVNIETCNQN